MSLFEQWLQLNDFNLNELDEDSLGFVYMQIEDGVAIENIEYFG